MANKNKIIAQVQRHIQKGNWDRAIKDLQKVVQDDPSDVRTLLKLGDVFAKKGDHENASQVYRQVAESYSDQGFFLKAVAVYKQILKYDNNHLDVVLRLAELYEHLGLTSEAMSQYQRAAEIHDGKGDNQAALDVVRRMVELDPDNVALRIKLAEAVSSAGQTKEAAAEFERAADVLRNQNRIDDYLKVAERLVFHDPNRPDVLKELARLYMARGDPKRALSKLQMCFKANEKDIETLTLLAQAFSDLGQVQKTRYVYQELVRQYEERGQAREAAEVRRALSQLDPGPDEPSPNASQTLVPQHSGAHPIPTPPHEPSAEAKAELQEALNYSLDALPFFQDSSQPSQPPPPRLPTEVPVPTEPPRAPQPFGAAQPQPIEDEDVVSVIPQPMAPPPPPPGDEGSIEKILSEADVYLKYGLQQKALDHTRGAFRIDPDSVEAYVKMRDIYVSMGDNTRAAEAVASALSICRQGNDPRAEGMAADLGQLSPGHPLLSGQPYAGPQSEGDNISIDISDDPSSSDLDLSFEAPVEASLDLDDAIEYETESSDDEQVFVLGTAPEGKPALDASAISEPDDEDLSLNDGDDDAFVLIGDPEDDPVETAPPASGGLGVAASAFDASFQTANLPRMPGGGTGDAVHLSGPLSAPSGLPLSEPPPSTLPQAPMSGDLSGPLSAPSSPPTIADTPSPLAQAAESSPSTQALYPDNDELNDELDEIDFLVEARLFDEAKSALESILQRAPGHPRATALLESIQPDQMSVSGDLLGGFAEEAPSDPLSAEDHYDQGMLFKELGRLDDAIRELERASHSGERAAGALEMLGMCYLEKSEPVHAITYFTQALERVPEGPASTNLKYELGAAYEQTNDVREALSWFEACAADNAAHRDVQARLSQLMQSSASDLTPGAHVGSEAPNKISYL